MTNLPILLQNRDLYFLIEIAPTSQIDQHESKIQDIYNAKNKIVSGINNIYSMRDAVD